MTLYVRCEVWEEFNDEYDTLFYIRDDENNRYYINGEVDTLISNPLIGKINIQRFWKELYHISKQASDSTGCLTGCILLDDGITQVDIIIKEPDVFPYVYKEWYDENNYYHRNLDIDYEWQIDSLIKFNEEINQ